MNRRDFLKTMIAAAAAPAIVKAENIMKVWVPPEKEIFMGVDLSSEGDHFYITREVTLVGLDENWAEVTEAVAWVHPRFCSFPKDNKGLDE